MSDYQIHIVKNGRFPVEEHAKADDKMGTENQIGIGGESMKRFISGERVAILTGTKGYQKYSKAYNSMLFQSLATSVSVTKLYCYVTKALR